MPLSHEAPGRKHQRNAKKTRGRNQRIGRNSLLLQRTVAELQQRSKVIPVSSPVSRFIWQKNGHVNAAYFTICCFTIYAYRVGQDIKREREKTRGGSLREKKEASLCFLNHLSFSGSVPAPHPGVSHRAEDNKVLLQIPVLLAHFP